MLFHSLGFLLFFPLVVLVYFLLPKKVRYLWLLGASYYYYMCWNAKYALLMLASTLITYLTGLWMEAVGKRRGRERRKILKKKWIVFLSFSSNLGILFFYKYFNFAAESLTWFFRYAKIQASLPRLDILLPVGISFYTFQALSYTVDVYRGDVYAERNFFRYALFVSFFPQLVAGPIERSKDLLVQLGREHDFSYDDLRQGLWIMVWGFFLKLVIADRTAIFVDTVYGNPGTYEGWYLIIATVLFHFQVYCDFAGYSTIALGAARVMGIRLTENFKAPYLSRSIGEFWRRWHLSLGAWFRDYLYFPLGGSRKGKAAKYRNLMLVFLLCGLWHGASWNYVIWGLLNGLYQVLGEVLKPVRDGFVRFFRLNRDSAAHQVVQILITMALLTGFVPFFRTSTVPEALAVLRSMAQAANPWILVDGSLYGCGLDEANFRFLLFSLGILVFADICRYREIRLSQVLMGQNAWARGLVFGLAVGAVLVFGIWGPMTDSAAFIYYQF